MASTTTTHGDASHGHDGHGHDDEHGAHAVPLPLLIGVWAALMGLTGLTVWSAQYHLGALDLPVAMGIATVKALLVALIFMHLMWDRPFNGLIFMSSLVFAGLFVTFSLLDTSQNQPVISQRTFDAPPELIQPPNYTEIAAEHASHAGDHGDAEHGDADHGDADHGDAEHGDAEHGDAEHGDADHGDTEHGDADHGDAEHAEGAHADGGDHDPGDHPEGDHDTESHDGVEGSGHDADGDH